MDKMIIDIAPYVTVLAALISASVFFWRRALKNKTLLLTIKSSDLRSVEGLWIRFQDTGLINNYPSSHNGDIMIDPSYYGRRVDVEVLENNRKVSIASATLDYTNGRQYAVIKL